jgi:hypothetical protein
MRWLPLSLLTDVNLKSILSDLPFFWQFICLVNLFPSFHCEPMFVFLSEMCFLYATNDWVLFLNPTCYSVSFDWGIEAINMQC